MSKEKASITRLVPIGPLTAFVVLSLVGNIASVLYALRRVEPSPLFILFWYLAAAWLFAYWMRADRLQLGTVDSGMFALALWPIVVPRHLIRTRGWKGGLIVIGLLVLLFLATYAISLGIFFALRPAA
ncbi:MAG TPA: hypothetical protein VIE39_02425 [Thermoanaerobaculia bacterium]